VWVIVEVKSEVWRAEEGKNKKNVDAIMICSTIPRLAHRPVFHRDLDTD
jgi:hypothetical protein